MLNKFRSGESKKVTKIVTGDESWIYQIESDTKQQSTVWLFPDEAPPQKVKRTRSAGKQMAGAYLAD